MDDNLIQTVDKIVHQIRKSTRQTASGLVNTEVESYISRTQKLLDKVPRSSLRYQDITNFQIQLLEEHEILAGQKIAVLSAQASKKKMSSAVSDLMKRRSVRTALVDVEPGSFLRSRKGLRSASKLAVTTATDSLNE